MRAWMALLGLAMACRTSTAVSVRGGEIHRHLVELRRDQHALVEVLTTKDEARESGTTHSETIAMSQRVTLSGKPQLVLEATIGCPAYPPFRGAEITRPCPLVDHRDDYYMLRSSTGFDAHKTAVGIAAIVGLAGTAGLTYCAFECSSFQSHLSIAALGAELVALTIWAMASGGLD
ncbi:MAG: hypothetical protein JWO36_1239 [Myxococcales bacterium]|nr:hypothetical protein [Myxococcales bacterium]